MPVFPGTAVSTPILEEQIHEHDVADNATDDEGLGRGAGKSWLGDLDGCVLVEIGKYNCANNLGVFQNQSAPASDTCGVKLITDERDRQSQHQTGYAWHPCGEPATAHHRLWDVATQGVLMIFLWNGD